ncbi:hypothetical protein D5F01_LYC18009 [Larimichthys crocea]|uniref:Uncharacterized protein n=1 Tax=Larimichthys crocea TaxID=215358 RepID=A0A6G0I080_LARCR|nr:hypothetical protein D5F01_LYC18009 [Larimichthys crocea]
MLTTASKADKYKALVDGLHKLLQTGGFEICQWASNMPAVIEHLPHKAISESNDLWLSQTSRDLQEPTLGLRWDLLRDSLRYKHKPVVPTEPTMRNVYKVLASQYDPLGYIVPFTTRAKVLVQDLWREQIGWDEPIRPQSLRDRWLDWEQEIPDLIQMELPRCYAPASADAPTPEISTYSATLLREHTGPLHTYGQKKPRTKSMSHSCWLDPAPKKQLSMP